MRILADRERKARKAHQCWWCRTEIEPGERYHEQVNTYDGHFQSIKMHLDCDAAWKRWWDEVNPDGYEEALDPWESDDRPIRGGWKEPTR